MFPHPRLYADLARYAIANVLIGVVLFYVLGSSVLHYSGAWYARFLPMSDASTYDNTGQPYNTTRVLNPDFTLNEQAYQDYSPLFIRYEAISVRSGPWLTGTAHRLP